MIQIDVDVKLEPNSHLVLSSCFICSAPFRMSETQPFLYVNGRTISPLCPNCVGSSEGKLREIMREQIRCLEGYLMALGALLECPEKISSLE